MTSGPTDAILGILDEYRIDPADISNVKVTLPPYGYRLVGHDFKIGENPTVDGQFSAQYCVANVLLRGGSKIRHFTANAVRDPEIRKYTSLVSVHPDVNLDLRGHTATDIEVTTKDGKVYRRGLDIAPGFPGNPLTDDDHMTRFMDCADFGADWIDGDRINEILSFIRNIGSSADVRSLVYLLTDMSSGGKVSTG